MIIKIEPEYLNNEETKLALCFLIKNRHIQNINTSVVNKESRIKSIELKQENLKNALDILVTVSKTYNSVDVSTSNILEYNDSKLEISTSSTMIVSKLDSILDDAYTLVKNVLIDLIPEVNTDDVLAWLLYDYDNIDILYGICNYDFSK